MTPERCAGPSHRAGRPCGLPAVAHGLCEAHYQQSRRRGELRPLREGPPLVSVPGLALRLPQDVAAWLEASAERQGVTVSEVARAALAAAARKASP